jgi:Zn finger protein HypA/HybF involved in hydrogenase expression
MKHWWCMECQAEVGLSKHGKCGNCDSEAVDLLPKDDDLTCSSSETSKNPDPAPICV